MHIQKQININEREIHPKANSIVQNVKCHCLQKFNLSLRKLFYKLGHLIAKHPSYFITVPVFLTLVLCTGIQKLEYKKDPEELFSPKNGEGRRDRRIVESLFPVNYSTNFDPARLSGISPFGMIFVTAKDNGSMFRGEVFNDVVSLDEAIKELTIEWQGVTYNYTDVCAMKNGQCYGNQILDVEDFIPEIENGSLLLNYPITLYPLILPFFLGGVDVNETEGILYGAKAISLSYWFRNDCWKQKERALLFEEKFLELIESQDYQHINVARYASRTLGDEFDKNANAVFSYAGVAFAIMISFSICSVFLLDWVRSKVIIGVVGVASASFATISAFGFLMYWEVPFTGVNLAAPFLMLGIGLDDMFVVLSAWHRTKIQDEVPIRLAETYSEAAVSITITSLTNMLSFFIGICTPFPAVQFFCLYTGFSILFTYIWFITFFGGCLAVAGYQERNQKHIFTCRKVLSKSEAETFGRCYKFWCAGGINSNDQFNKMDNQEPILMIFFRDYLGKALNISAVKICVICLFLVYMGGAIYGCSKIKEGLEREKLTLDDSYSVDFFETENKFFRKYPLYRLQIVINENLTYSDLKTKQELLELHQTVENLTSIGESIFTQSWIRGFYNYIERRPELKEIITDEASFIKTLKSKYLRPTSPEYLDIKFNEDETRIIASRFVVQAYDIKDTNGDKEMMQDLRRVASVAPFNVVVYHPLFVFFDQYSLVRHTCLQTITMAAIVMMVVSLIFIPNPLCSLWVAFSIVSIEIGVIGYMSIWGVNLDCISMMNLIMCVGFSVDFSAHISYAFLTAYAATPAGRVEECLYNVGLPICQGGLSTIFGVMVLSMAPSYIFTTFFKTIFLVIFFGLLHGIFLLPVMLSIVGPGSCSKNKISISKDVDSKTLPSNGCQAK